MAERALDDVYGITDEDRKKVVAVMKRNLQGLAREMLEHDDAVQGNGVTFDEVRRRAEIRGWLTGEEQGRTLSFGAALMRAAGGFAAGFAESKHKNSHSRIVRRWKLTQAAGETGE